jgi:lysophospholipase L1-like esterase
MELLMRLNRGEWSKLILYSDSYGRDIPTSLSKINNDLSVSGEVRPGAKLEDVLKNCVRDCTVLGPQDHVVIMGGTNDISRNETINCINTLKTTLSALTSTNVVVLNIPARHDLVKESIVNKEIRKANMDINKVCKRFSNVEVLEIHNISRACYTRHVQHLNKTGKVHISQEINKILGKNKRKNHSNVIAFGYLNQGNQ